ncbi:MAG: SDR family NAD(P)-dependent oxidoreductase, partial [Microthrixaceae bacterium]
PVRVPADDVTRRVLVTDAGQFLGPASVERFRTDGEDVVALRDRLESRGEAEAIAEEAGPFDVVVANLDVQITVASVLHHDDDTVADVFGRLVEPLFWLFGAFLPSMVAAGDGAFVVPTSATALRSSSHPISAYQAARAAQVSLVRSVGREVAPQGAGRRPRR